VCVCPSTMWNELFARQNKGVADAKALRDASDSLAQMLNNFYKKRYSEWSDAQRNAVVSELDMAPVSAQCVSALENCRNASLLNLLARGCACVI
jgi:hypothetical protein